MFNQLTDTDTLKAFLGKHKVTPKKSMGQNFLVCEEVVEATIIAIAEGPKKITELGAGVGTLTQALLFHGCDVRAIEKDDAFARILAKSLKIKVTHADLKDVDWTWDKPYQLVGNVPYNLSGYIIRRLVQLDPPPVQALFLMQEEVVERLAAQPPQMSLLSLAASLWGEVHPLLRIPASCFWPQPNVSSRLVLIAPHSSPPGPPAGGGEIEGVLNIARPFFQQKRKQIGGVLQREFDVGETTAQKVLTKAQVDPEQRPQELTVEQWKALAKEISN